MFIRSIFLTLVLFTLSIFSVENSRAELMTDFSGKIDPWEVVQKVIADIQLRQTSREILVDDRVLGYLDLHLCSMPSSAEANTVVLSTGEQIFYVAEAGLLEWHSLSRDLRGLINLSEMLPLAHDHPLEPSVDSNGYGTQAAPIIAKGVVFIVGTGVSAASCAWLQHQCHTGCIQTCPCGASPNFNCISPRQGISTCNCNCTQCPELNPLNLNWPWASPTSGPGLGSFPHIPWDFSSNSPWVVGGDGGNNYGWLMP